ncbi:MAG: flippase [Trueperaceae bacterium]
MTQRRSLRRNSLLNVFGQAAPVLAAFFTFPHLIYGLGEARFGALSLAWVLTGYASIFDFGLGRALTHLVARNAAEKKSSVNAIAWTAFSVTAVTGLMATIVMYFLAPTVVTSILGIDGELQGETIRSLRLIALFLPAVVATAGIRGLLEGSNCFGSVNLVRIPTGVLNYLAPLLVLLFTSRLEPVVLAVVLTRCMEALGYLLLALRRVPGFSTKIELSRLRLHELVRLGGWMTLSNIVTPITLQFDRFLVASLTSLADVTYYVTPHSIVTRMRIVPTGILSVLFPAFSEAFAHDPQRARQLYLSAQRSLFLILLPAVVLVIIFAKPGLALWLDSDFASRSYRVAQILAVGVLIHSIAYTSANFLQARGLARTTALVSLAEAPFYLGYTYALITLYGINGAAIAWLLRVTITSLVLASIVEIVHRNSNRSGGSRPNSLVITR